MAPAPRYAFVAEWLDPNSGYLWKYQLFFYPETNEVEMVSSSGHAAFHTTVIRMQQIKYNIIHAMYRCPQNDIKNNKVFLRKVRYDDLKVDQLFMGNNIIVYGRQLKLVQYSDDFTRNKLEPSSEK